MRKFLVLAMAAAATLLVAVPATASVTAKHDVLTTGSVGGPNVAAGAKLQANLKSGTKATFQTSSGYVKCSSVSFTDDVKKNPAAPGTADEKLVAQTYKSCTTNIASATGPPSVKLNGLPYTTTLSDSKGDPVTVTGTVATITVASTVGTLTCQYAAKHKKTTGSASNAAQTISFTNQPFTLISGPSACPGTGSFSATFGPVKDTSVKGDPHVYVN